MKLIVGLGNPGKEYDNTRHNMGFFFLDNYAKSKNLEIKTKKFDGLLTEFVDKSEKIILLKPQTYMNLSGESVRKVMDFYKIDYKDILVISDDLDLPLGNFRLKSKGSCGGHNGLRNIEQYLGTQGYKRLIEQLDEVLEDYTLTKDEETISAGEKRIYAPNIVAISNGKPIQLETGISEKLKDPYGKLTSEIKKYAYNTFNCQIKCLKEKSTTCQKNSC